MQRQLALDDLLPLAMSSFARQNGAVIVGASALLLAACASPAQPAARRQVPVASATSPVTPIDLERAAQYFAEVDATCRAEAGKLWGESLCGPILLVDPVSRFAVANAPDGAAALTARVHVYVGALPAGASVANTAFEWSGVRWSEVVWPGIPEDARERKILFVHEAFHRVQPKLGPEIAETDNGHLASPEGRALMRLEWRALSAALARSGAERARAISDALSFRAARRRLFPAAAAAERALERNEGLAEYTARRVVGASDEERRQLARASLATAETKPSYVRSFAYGSGPAYGILLDEAGADWRHRALAGDDLGDLLTHAVGASSSADAEAIRQREASYDGEAVRKQESDRWAAHQGRLAAFRARLIEGATLTLPTHRLGLNFNPNELEPLDDAGTVYPTLKANDVWGELVVTSGGVLLARNGSTLVVGISGDSSAPPTRGDGWELHLAPGWTIEPAKRAGDWVLHGPP